MTTRNYPELRTSSVSLRLPDDLDACIAQRDRAYSGTSIDSSLVRVFRLGDLGLNLSDDGQIHVCFGFDSESIALVGTPANVRRLLVEALAKLDAECGAAREEPVSMKATPYESLIVPDSPAREEQ